MRALSAIILILMACLTGLGQKDSVSVCDAIIEGQDTIAVIMLDAADIPLKAERSKKFKRRYYRLEPKVVKVYPYAKAAGDLMAQYDAELQHIEGERERKAFVKRAENELKSQFEGDLKEMTISEGMILISLIDRETGDTSYELIKEIKGGFSAFMWQSMARLFGHNLKDQYDPEGDDEIVELIVQRIERNEIKVRHQEVSIYKD